MTDRELLEFAAKAAEIEIEFDKTSGLFWLNNRYSCLWWDPLTNDGDAFRLMVLLNIYPVPPVNASKNDGIVSVYYPVDSYGQEQSIRERINGDHLAATRRVIVRVAAEIGKTK